MDIGTFVLGDLDKKNQCIILWVEKMVHGLKHLRSIQLHLMNCGLGLEDSRNDVTFDIDYTKALLDEAVVMVREKLAQTTSRFVDDVHETMSLDSLNAIPMDYKFDGVDHINTQDMSLTQLHSELWGPPMRFVFYSAPL